MLRRITVIGMLAVALVAVACGDDAEAPGATGPSVGSAPSAGAFQIRPVIEALDPGASEASTCAASDGGCAAEHAGDDRTVLEAVDGTRYAVGPAAVTETDVARAEAVEDAPTWSVAVQLTPDGSSALEELTSASIGERIAIVVGGSIVAAPVVNADVSSGSVAIASTTRDAAMALADTIDGGAA